MSTQISSELMGMLYVMDEPSIGLHPRDSLRVIDTIKKLRSLTSPPRGCTYPISRSFWTA